MKEELATLFSGSLVPQNQIWQRVFARIESFAHAKNVSTKLNGQSLAVQFQDSRIPDEAISVENYLEYLENDIIPHSINMSSPRCLGHMTSVLPNFMAPLGEFIITLNQNVVKRDASRTFTLLERQSIAMLHRLTYSFPQHFYEDHAQTDTSTLGITTSGGTISNITALWIARNSCFGPADNFRGIEEEGIVAALKFYGYDSAVIIGSNLMHYSIEKAASILGLGTNGIVKVPVDQEGRIIIPALRKTVAECISRRQRVIAIVGIAGTTECGSIDSLSRIADIAEEYKIHFHVDAAWGAPLLFSRHHRHKLVGIERADSVTIDGHKQLYLPIGNSTLLLCNPHIAKGIEKQARYMLQDGSSDLGKYSVEGSRAGTAVFLHAALHIIGCKGYEFLVDENIRKTSALAASLRHRTEFELLIEPETNILVYRYIPATWRKALARGKLTSSDNSRINLLNEKIQKVENENGRTFVSRTTLTKTYDGVSSSVVALRAVIANPFTREEDFTTVLEDQLGIAATLEMHDRN